MKKQKNNKIVIFALIVALIAVYGYIAPQKDALAVDSITDAADLLTDSQANQYADHTITFTTGTTTPNTGYINVEFPNGPQTFGDIVDSMHNTCPAGYASSTPNTYTIRCTAGGPQAAGAKTINIYDLLNPVATGSQAILITNHAASGDVLERVQIRVAITTDVLMTARVDAVLEFRIKGVTTGTVVNGETCDHDSTATTTPFGTLGIFASTTICQELTVVTNADDGYSVTVEQDQELTSDSNSNINSFDNAPNSTGSSTSPHAWTVPTNELDIDRTYGHMGFTSQDSTLSWGGGDPFGDRLYVGFNNTDPIEVMYHTGPSDGTTDNIGRTAVAYTAEIGSLQEAGDYENTLTYICTPTY